MEEDLLKYTLPLLTLITGSGVATYAQRRNLDGFFLKAGFWWVGVLVGYISADPLIEWQGLTASWRLLVYAGTSAISGTLFVETIEWAHEKWKKYLDKKMGVKNDTDRDADVDT